MMNKVKSKKATGVLKELLDELEALPEVERKHRLTCAACEASECCTSFTRSVCGYPEKYGVVGS